MPTVPIQRQKVQYTAPALICIDIVCSISSSTGAMQSFQFYESPVPNSPFHFWNKLDLQRWYPCAVYFTWMTEQNYILCQAGVFFFSHSDLLVYCSLLRGIYRQIYSNYLLSAAGDLVDILLYISPPGAIRTSDVACSVPSKSAWLWHYNSHWTSAAF